MKCQACGGALPPDVLLCPHCGTIQKTGRPAARKPISAPGPGETQPVAVRNGRHFGATLLIIAGVACALLAMLAASGVAGYFAGMDDRAKLQAQEADKFFKQGLDDLAAGKLTLAEADFAYVLSIDSDYSGAAQKLEEARQRILDTQRVEPTPTTSLQEALKDVLTSARQAYDRKDWATAISRLIQIRRLDPTFETRAVEDMLFNASYTYGLQLLDTDRLEEGVFYLEQAAALRPLDSNASQQAELAKAYLVAAGYWNVNWDLAIERFGELVAVAPNYKDT
ncbi:MAG TPA: hypothetical protein VJ754_05550, partial [Anaerolineae bacterium]|nr:hypothetical protein [Anaerolineae bacterium]